MKELPQCGLTALNLPCSVRCVRKLIALIRVMDVETPPKFKGLMVNFFFFFWFSNTNDSS